eukprot:TRINITY_DN4806_c0_g1_i1.p1 TRINITY_DN4806_c0_g1~~TRINITY_DN4806_c0_g1_i1.p1  ORF type:complete len:815 (-),score=165.32 TRINITY_DN4806_c0_g1_i1:26-2440(-)
MALINVLPELSEYEPKVEFIFLIDRSGSMDKKNRPEKVQSVMLEILNTMQNFKQSDVLFNIIYFGTDSHFLFESSVSPDTQYISEAEKTITEIYGDMGKSNIKGAIENMANKSIPDGFTRNVILISDGEFEDISDLLWECNMKADKLRFVVFGLGKNSIWFSKEIAKYGSNTSFVFLENDEQHFFNEKATSMIIESIKPSLKNITIDWKSPPNFYTNIYHPMILQGDNLLFYGKLSQDIKEIQVVIKGEIGGSQWENIVSIDTQHFINGDITHKIAASSYIKDIERGRSIFHNRGNGFTEQADDIENVSALLSEEYNVPSPFTKFVGVSDDEDISLEIIYPLNCIKKEPVAIKKGTTPRNFSAQFYTKPAIDVVLESEEFTLEEILAVPTIFSKCLFGRYDSLNEFIKRPHSIKKLFNLSTDISTDIKIVKLTCDILSLPMWKNETDIIYSQDILIDFLSRFRDILGNELEEVQIFGYWCNIFSGIYDANPQVFIDCLDNHGILLQLLDNIDNADVYKLYTNMLNLDLAKKYTSLIKWLLLEENFLICINKIKDENVSQEAKDNILSLYTRIVPEKELEDIQFNSLHFETIMDCLEEDGNFSEVFYQCMSVLEKMIGYYQKAGIIESIAEYIENKIPLFHNMLNVTKKRITTTGEVFVCGSNRVKIIHFLASLILVEVDTNYTKIIQKCVNLMVQCSTNNILHTAVSNLICVYLDKAHPEHIAENLPELMNIVIESFNFEKDNGFIAYTGHMTIIAERIVKYMSEREVNIDVDGEWTRFVNEKLVNYIDNRAPYKCSPPSKHCK